MPAKQHSIGGESVEVRSFDAGMADGAKGVSAPLVRGDEQYVSYGWLYYYFCPPEITNKLFKLKLIRLFLLTNLLLF